MKHMMKSELLRPSSTKCEFCKTKASRNHDPETKKKDITHSDKIKEKAYENHAQTNTRLHVHHKK